MATNASSKDLPKAGMKRKLQQSSSKIVKKRKLVDSSKDGKGAVSSANKPQQAKDYSSNWKFLQQVM